MGLYDRWKDRKGELQAAMVAKQPSYIQMVEELDSFYHGDHSPMEGSGGYLARTFPQSYAGGRLRLSSMPFAKRVVDAQATLFHRRPTWMLYEPDADESLPREDANVQRFKALRDETHMDLQCRIVQRRDRLWNTVFARPAHRLGKICIDVIKPSLVWVIEGTTDAGNLDDAQAIVVQLSKNRWEVWEAPCMENEGQWTYGVIDLDAKTEEDPLFEGSFINGYGQFPFVRFSHDPSSGIYGIVDQSLLDMQVGVDLLESWSDFQFRMGFTIVKITTSKDLGKEDMPISPDLAVRLTPGAQEDFDRVASGLDCGQLTSYIESKVKRFAAMAAIDPDFLSSEGKQFLAALTGIAKQFDRLDLQELREESEIPYEAALPDLFDKLVAVNNFHRTKERIDPDLILRIGWYTPSVPQNRLQEAQADVLDIEQGVLTPDEVRANRLKKPIDDVGPAATHAEDADQ